MLIQFVEILTSIFGVLMSVGHFPQAYKIYKKKSAKEISLIMYVTFFVGMIVWLTYGLLITSWPIIISFTIGLVGSGLILFLALKYRT